MQVHLLSRKRGAGGTSCFTKEEVEVRVELNKKDGEDETVDKRGLGEWMVPRQWVAAAQCC